MGSDQEVEWLVGTSEDGWMMRMNLALGLVLMLVLMLVLVCDVEVGAGI